MGLSAQTRPRALTRAYSSAADSADNMIGTDNTVGTVSRPIDAVAALGQRARACCARMPRADGRNHQRCDLRSLSSVRSGWLALYLGGGSTERECRKTSRGSQRALIRCRRG